MAFHECIVHQGQGLKLFLAAAIVGSMNRSFPASPFEQMSLHGARNRKCKVRLTFFDLLGAQHLQKDAQGLLGNVGASKPHLLFGDAANSAVQHGNKGHNHQDLDELWFGGTSREQLAE